ncbi:MAG: hypothetical protein RRB13_09265 [bacterium]|nr:hypothetical protein [bacterium]
MPQITTPAAQGGDKCYLCGREFSSEEPGVLRPVLIAQGDAQGIRESGHQQTTIITLRSERRICKDCDRPRQGPRWWALAGLLLGLSLALGLFLYWRQ